MTFAAWFELHADDEIVAHPTALRVYALLLRNSRIFTEPQDTKVWWLADKLGAERETVRRALELLIARGYVVEHERGFNNVRRVTVAVVRQDSGGWQGNPPPSSAVPA